MGERIEELLKEVMEYRRLLYYRKHNEKRYINYKLCHYDFTWEQVITHVEIGLDQAFYSEVNKAEIPDCTTVLVNKYHQLSRDYIPGDLEMITPEFNISTLMLRHLARLSFEEMCRTAARDGIILKAISTFRSFLYQNQVYYKNWIDGVLLEQYQAERDKVSARAGHSEHQTGLAIDINDLEEVFADTPEGRWLEKHSIEYGYILRYPKGKEDITGYNYEPWHFRFVGREHAEQIYQLGLTLDEYYIRYLRKVENGGEFLS